MRDWTIAICDDNIRDREYLSDCCKKILGHSENILCFSDGADFIKAVKRGFTPKVLLLDISMEGTSGLSVKDYLESMGEKVYIVFTTGYPDYMPEAFGVNVMGYLKKPVEKSELEAKFLKIEQRHFSFGTLEITDINSKPFKINMRNISKIEADDHYTRVILKDMKQKHQDIIPENVLVRKTMNEWENELDGRIFVRLNKSVIINMGSVERLGGNVAVCNGEEIKISRNKKSEIVRILANYHDFIF